MQIKKFNFRNIFVLAVITLVSFFSFFKLGSTLMNVDAQHWFLRSQNFIKAVKNLDFTKTYQDPKPGVTVMWLSGFSLDTFLSLYKIKYGFTPLLYTFETFPLANFSATAPLVVLNIFFLICFYIILSKLLNSETALLALIILGAHPVYVGISRFLHVDSTLSIFMSLSFITLTLIFNQKNTYRYVILSGLLAGLALLTKTQALVLIPFSFLAIAYYLFNKKAPANKYFKLILLWIIPCALSFFIFFPAMWVHPVKTISSIYTEALYVAQVGRTSYQDYFYYLQNLPRTAGLPLVVFTVAGIVISLFFKKEKNAVINIIICFGFLYLIQMSLIPQKIDRYIIPLFPVMAVLSAYGIFKVTPEKHFRKIVFILFVAEIFTLIYYAPYYETFAINNYETNSYGSLYNEAGAYLNSLPNANNINTVAMTKVYSLKPFVKGHIYGHEETIPIGTSVSYLVTNDYWLKQYGQPAHFSGCKLEKTIKFRSKPFWDIYHCFSYK